MLVVVCGLPGSGKSEAAKLIAQKINASHLQTDVVRKKLNFSIKAKKETYKTLLREADKILKNNRSVVLDGTFYRQYLRDWVKNLAKNQKIKIFFIEVICDEKIIQKRINKRYNKFKKGYTESPADFRVYLKMKKVWRKIKEKRIIIDNSKDLKWLKKQIRRAVENLNP